MLRRPPGEGRLVADQRRGKVFLALAVFVLPWLTLADAQQQHPKQQQLRYHQPQVANILHGNAPAEPQQADVHRHLKSQEDGDYDVARASDDRREPPSRPRYGSSPFEDDHALGKLAATVAPSGRQGRDTVTTAHHGRDKKYGVNHANDYPNHHDASALATVAPDFPVRASKSPRQLTSILSGAGLSSPHSARSLERWEVEDYVLVATVDGHLHALSKDSGDERWHLQVVQPTVETLHHRPNNTLGEDYRYHPLDDYIWAVEPTQDGPVYVWMPSGVGTGLMPTGFTMKQLVDELGPYAVPNPPVVYTGDKKTTMVSMDAATGRVLKWFGQGSSQVEEGATCFPPNGLVDSQSEACGNTGTITLSRTEYTVSIHRQDDGRPLATLRYSEWGPNSFDQDLHRQYRTTQDNRVLTSASNGRLYSVDAGNVTSQSPLKFSGPAARVFDVARPDDVPAGSNPELVLLPQPRPPVASGDGARTKAIYLNRTESGSWYAMSSFSYPLMSDAPLAQIHSRDRFEGTWSYDEALVEKALIGNHLIGSVQEDTDLPNDLVPWSSMPPGLPDRQDGDDVHDFHNNASLQVHDPDSDLTIVDKFRTLPEYAYARVLDIVLNPLLIPIILCAIWAARYGKPGHRKVESEIATSLEASSASSDDVATYVGREAPAEVPAQAQAGVPGEEAANVPPTETSAVPEAGVDGKAELNPELSQDGLPLQPQLPNGESPEKKKKKTHRGTRGGTKHKKKKQDTASQSSDDRPNSGPTEEDINRIKHIPPETQLKPNVKSVVDDPRDVSAAGFETTNGLRVNLDDQLGMGSNGTVVYSGTFHMREVAVKRMLAVFYDIAYQETQLLLESDNHPNVIQYYAFHQENAFLYIALERCHASLADIVDKPHMHRELARAGEMDIPHVLLQIANGLSHLHNLRIVHRDLKPQNILVTMTKDGRPRLVVSDFGLCKKLDGAQSSFGATTAHAAGTSGWRAPELLLDDDARESSHSMTSSHHSESSQLISSGLMPNRRATRAIDIFSLGLVFFYVLTKGSHPFDCGDRYMREVNIRKGQLNLQPLDVLGDYAFEAENLIRLMLQSEPRQRPNIREVMAHPFFWDAKKRLTFLCDVSDHFEKEQRDPPSDALVTLEKYAPDICRGDFLKCLTKDFVDSLGKQRKYTGSRLLDLLRALRNKWNHREDMSETLKKSVGTSYEDYLGYWTRRFPNLLVICYDIIYVLDLQDATRFKEYFEPMKP